MRLGSLCPEVLQRRSVWSFEGGYWHRRGVDDFEEQPRARSARAPAQADEEYVARADEDVHSAQRVHLHCGVVLPLPRIEGGDVVQEDRDDVLLAYRLAESLVARPVRLLALPAR